MSVGCWSPLWIIHYCQFLPLVIVWYSLMDLCCAVLCLVTQSCLTLCDPVDYSPPGSSVLELFQARILEWFAMTISRGSSQPKDRTQVYCIAGRFFTSWANLILGIYDYKYLSCYVTRKKMKVADGIRFANQLTLRLSWIIWKNCK